MIKSNRWGRAGIAAVAAATLLPLAACTDGAEAAADGGQAGTKGGQVADGGGEATIRFNWWGSDARARTQEAFIEICMAEHPEITVLGETASWNDYQMRLATQAAANDIPDVFMFIDPFMYEYIDAGHMLDLRTVADYLDLSDFPEITFADVTGPNGEIWGVSTGHSGHGMIINPAVFERYGIDLPDDTTWSWDDFKEISIAISEASAAAGGQTVGSTIKMTNQMLQVWLRQRGETPPRPRTPRSARRRRPWRRSSSSSSRCRSPVPPWTRPPPWRCGSAEAPRSSPSWRWATSGSTSRPSTSSGSSRKRPVTSCCPRCGPVKQTPRRTVPGSRKAPSSGSAPTPGTRAPLPRWSTAW